jgi:hypothetical protein
MPGIISQSIPILVLLTFAVGVSYTFYIIGTQVGGNDNTESINSSLKTVLGINFGLMVVFGLFNYFLFKSNSAYTDLYNTTMIYLAFFLSFMAMSITLLDKTSI